MSPVKATSKMIMRDTLNKKAGLSLLELIIAMSILTMAIVMTLQFTATSQMALVTNEDVAFAVQKASSIINELRAYADSHSSTGGASVLDIFDDGAGTNPKLTIDSTVSDPAHILSGNIWLRSRWQFARQISITKFPSLNTTNVRIATVKIFRTQPGQNNAAVFADVSSVIMTLGNDAPPQQVYDVYLLGVENIPGWWVYLAYLTPFIENALSDMESRNPGMQFRRHWITKAAYGRDQEYNPYFNKAADSTAAINYAYFYPGSMPAGSAVSQYYIPDNVKARVNVDGATVNDYNGATNPYPYTLADQYNHAMRWPDENALYQARLAAGLEQRGTMTYRLLLDDMIQNPQNYRNALFINLHGELLPMPSIRNYSDAAKDPVTHPQWRVVTHPEQICYPVGQDLKLRVYAYLADPSLNSDQAMTTTPITLSIPNMNLTTPGDVSIVAIKGGTDQNPQDGIPDIYTADVASTTAGAGPYAYRMYANVGYDAGNARTIITFYNTPLRTPMTGGTCGLDTTRCLYGMDYIPSPVSGSNFSRDLTDPGNTWDTMGSTALAVGTGGALVATGTADYIYGFRGGGQTNFWRYSISTNSWSNMTSALAAVGAGGALVTTPTGAYIFAFRGGTQNTFWRYTISSNSWLAMTNAPNTVGAGGALVCTPTADFIYAFRGNNSTTFWRYSIAGNSWVTMTATSAAVGVGGALVYPASGDYIYAFLGNNTNAFWRYSISLNNWTVLTNAPGNVADGAALVYPGSGDYIYAFQGGTTAYWRYSISGNSWTVMMAAPAAVAAGGALVYTGGSAKYIYGFQGGTTVFWRCSGLPKNTARWIITIPTAVASREVGNGNQIITFETRIGTDLTTGALWPTRITPTNISKTYIWRNYTLSSIPFSERYQFQGDPRHCPYKDVYANNGYNWYFDNLRDATKNAIAEWPSISSTLINGGSDSLDGWHGQGGTSGDMLEFDVPRFFLFLRAALTGANCVYTSVTGFSYYYMGLGNEIGYDSANGFPSSIPVSNQPFNGGGGSGYENSITGAVKYIRENVSPYWWGKPWLGENYPDGVYATQWAVNGNLNSGSGANTFVRIGRDSVRTSGAAPLAKPNTLPPGTTFNALTCVRRTNQYGCTSFFNIGTTTSTYRHGYYDGQTGTITAAGQEIANQYYFPLPTIAPISRPFQLANNWGAAPTEFNLPDYSAIRCSATVTPTFYTHQQGGNWQGSALVQLANPVNSNAFIVVNGLDRTVGSGSAFIGRYAVLSLIHSFLNSGLTGTPSRIVQLPRLEIKQPNVMTELNNPSVISMTWSIGWTRWDKQKYTMSYPAGFAETQSDLRYTRLYSMNNGKTWLNMGDDAPATPGYPDQSRWVVDTSGDQNYNWDVSNTGYFVRGDYLIMVEAYRVNQPSHYAYHQQRIYINR